MKKNECILVCSDGLTDALSHNQLENIWNSTDLLIDKLDNLCNTILKQLIYDDLSIVIYQHE